MTGASTVNKRGQSTKSSQLLVRVFTVSSLRLRCTTAKESASKQARTMRHCSVLLSFQSCYSQVSVALEDGDPVCKDRHTMASFLCLFLLPVQWRFMGICVCVCVPRYGLKLFLANIPDAFLKDDPRRHVDVTKWKLRRETDREEA